MCGLLLKHRAWVPCGKLGQNMNAVKIQLSKNNTSYNRRKAMKNNTLSSRKMFQNISDT